MLDRDRIGVDAEIVPEPSLRPDGDVAQTDGVVTFVEQGLRHDPHRIGEVDQPRAGVGAGRHLLGQPEHDRDGAQRLGQPSGSRGLLAQASVPHRQRLVDVARRLAPDAQLDHHEVRPLERGVRVGRRRERPAPAPRFRRMRSESPPTTSRRTSLGSSRTRSSTTNRSSTSHRPSTSSGVYVLPPPTTTTLVPTQRNVTSVRVRSFRLRAGGAGVRRGQHQDRCPPRLALRRRPRPGPGRPEQPPTRRPRRHGAGADRGGRRGHRRRAGCRAPHRRSAPPASTAWPASTCPSTRRSWHRRSTRWGGPSGSSCATTRSPSRGRARRAAGASVSSVGRA